MRPVIGAPELQRRTLRTLFAAQVLSGAGLAAGITVGALLAEDMLGSTGSAGLPTMLFTLGSALAAMLVGRLSGRSGRRPGLAVGYGVGALGGAGVVAAAAIDSVTLLFIALFLYGSGSATNLQARYAGADLAEPAERGRASGTVLLATTAGAVLGPNLVDFTGGIAGSLGLPELSGPFLLATVAYAFGGLFVAAFLRPDPLLTARRLAREAGAAAGAGSAEEHDDPRAVQIGAAAMVVAQLVMVAVMTMTPVHMLHHGHDLGLAGFVISLHVAAMFLPSPLSGFLVDRYGPRAIVLLSGFTLLASGLVAGFAPGTSAPLIAVGLMLLGLGWSFGIVAGTSMITSSVPLERRPRTQGNADIALALAGAGGGLASGFVVDAASFTALAVGGGLLALLVIPLALAPRRH